MTTIGVRELRQAASVHLRAVAHGESITITDRGVPVAKLVPLTGEERRAYELLRRHPHLRPAAAPRRPLLGTAAEPEPSAPALSDALAADRDDRDLLG